LLNRGHDTDAIAAAVWAVAGGDTSAEPLARLEADRRASQRVVDDLLADTQDRLESVRRLTGPEREQVIADFADELEGLRLVRARLNGGATRSDRPSPAAPVEREEGVRLQASWADGELVAWAGGPTETAATNDELADRLEALDGPKLGWRAHRGVPLDGGRRAEAVSIPLADALGWLVSVGANGDGEGVGASVRWLGHVAITAVGHVAQGAVVPAVHMQRRGDRSVEMAVRWQAALLDNATLDRLATIMPGTVRALAAPSVTSRTLVRDVINAVVHAVVAQAAGLLELPAPPPTVRTASDVAEAIITRLDGGAFAAPPNAGSDAADRLQRWARPAMSASRPRLVVQLVAEGTSDTWFLSVHGPGPQRAMVDVEQALAASKSTQPVADELARVERLLPVLLRAGALRRGQVYLSTDEAWEFMTRQAPMLQTAGFEVRVPALSRRRPKPALRLFTEPVGERAVGARQLNNVRWSAVFDDVELTADEVSRLATEARPLVQSRGQWVELDRLDLQEAAAALAERASTTQLTGAAVLRYAVGLEGTNLGQPLQIDGAGWAAELFDKAASVSREPVEPPGGFVGQLRTYQSEALGWLGFLDAVDLGGCLALDMGLGKTPTVLAHLARTASEGVALVIAPAAVVGNWQAEAAKFTPGLRVVVHHGASRTSASGLAAEVAEADIVITTYGTAVRDVEALAKLSWRHVILDEAQAIKNTASDTSQQLRRIAARTRLALTGTPIENGLGDLWSILDYCNPDLVGSRAAFSAQLAGEGEAALRALNGILVFRRTKAEPEVAAELPDKIDELDHCTMTREQIGLYQAVLDSLVVDSADGRQEVKKGAVLAAITALKQICNHPAAYQDDGRPLAGRSGKLARLEELVEVVFAAQERMLIFTHFAEWGKRLADHLTEVTGLPIACYHGGQTRSVRDRLVRDFQSGTGPGALVLSLTAGGTGLNLTAANHVVLYDRWWNPAKEDQARDRAWRIGQTRTVISHRLVCPGTIDERVEDIVAGKRRVADLVLPKSSSLDDLSAEQLRVALGLDPRAMLTEDDE
jgi:superfamily II DNA or RNA helicase